MCPFLSMSMKLKALVISNLVIPGCIFSSMSPNSMMSLHKLKKKKIIYKLNWHAFYKPLKKNIFSPHE
jgi:hypothetical protein